jgi:hypothetical protein
MSSKNILLTGLHGSGKTTFIAALWYAVNHLSDEISLSVNSLAGSNDEYLFKISIAWSRFQDVPRTNLNEEQKSIKLNLKRTRENSLVLVDIPDLSGETFRNHFDLREWSQDYDNTLDQINGLLIFIDPLSDNNTPKLIYQANELERILGQNESKEESTPAQWQHSFVPNQVKLVEILQFIFFHKPQLLPMKVALIISAWDRVLDLGAAPTPRDWVRLKLPLLYQFLETNSEFFQNNAFGVSAQGCDYKDEAKVNELLTKTPLERILIQENEIVSKDIARPIIWMLE